MKINKFHLIFLGLLVLLVGVKAADVSDNATVDVDIGGLAEITINTTGLSFSGVSPGTNATPIEVKIENTGSNSLTNIYLHVDSLDKETSNPWNNPSTSTGWSATSFLDVKNGTAGSSGTYYYVGSVVWNKTDDTSATGYTLNTSGGATCSTCKRSYGRIWFDKDNSASDSFYYWQLVNGSDGTCKSTSTVFKLQQTRGSKDVDGGTAAYAYTSSGNWLTFTISSGVGSGYCYAVYTDCTKFFVYKYDGNSTFPSCTAKSNLVDGPLYSAQYVIASFRARVESGHVQGSTTQGNLRVVATG